MFSPGMKKEKHQANMSEAILTEKPAVPTSAHSPEITSASATLLDLTPVPSKEDNESWQTHVTRPNRLEESV